ncbi:MAG: helix-turn-helix transcriptional regulator [Thermoplasmatales archaeon]|nr:helix-turn-helix transcriptional regulator [Thermoplasmatales archaeon]
MDKAVGRVLSTSIRRKVLEELIKRGKATAYEISKNLDIPDAAVGKHLEILFEAKLVDAPEVDISTGRLKKIYRPATNAEKVLKEFWDKEIRDAPKSIQKMYLNKECKENK